MKLKVLDQIQQVYIGVQQLYQKRTYFEFDPK